MEKSVPEERLVVNVLVLFIGCTNNGVCPPELIRIPESQGPLPDLTVEETMSDHWVRKEKAAEVERAIGEWLSKFRSLGAGL